MKKICLFATLVAAVFAIAGNPSAARAQGAAPGAGLNVAIIDLSYIFKNHNRFKAMTEDMRNKVVSADEQLKAQKGQIDQLQKRLNDLGTELRKDSPEYKQLDNDLTKRKIDLNAQIAMQKKDFLEQEAKIYYSVYTEILDEVQYFSDRNRISLVLRFNGDPINDTDPQEILKQLNKSVVYYNKSIDITPMILDSINRRGPAAAPVGGGVVNPGPARTGVPLQPKR